MKRKRTPKTMRGIAARARRLLKAASWMKPDDLVDYHSVIDGPVTHPSCHIESEPFILMGHTAVVKLKERIAVVAVEAVTPAPESAYCASCGDALKLAEIAACYDVCAVCAGEP